MISVLLLYSSTMSSLFKKNKKNKRGGVGIKKKLGCAALDTLKCVCEITSVSYLNREEQSHTAFLLK